MTNNAIAPQRHEQGSESAKENKGENSLVVAQAAAAAYSPHARPELAKSQNTADKALPPGAVDEHGLSFGSVSEKPVTQTDPQHKAGADARTAKEANASVDKRTAQEVTKPDSQYDSKMPARAETSVPSGAELPGSKAATDATKTVTEDTNAAMSSVASTRKYNNKI